MSTIDRNTRYPDESIAGSLTLQDNVELRKEEACMVATNAKEPFHAEHFTPLVTRDRSIIYDVSMHFENDPFSAMLPDQMPRPLEIERSPDSATPFPTSVRSSSEIIGRHDPIATIRRSNSPGEKLTQPSSPGSTYERPRHPHFPPPHGHPYPFYHPYYPPPPSHSRPPLPNRKTGSFGGQNEPYSKAHSEENISHSSHLPPPYPWPYPPHQMYFYPPPPYFPPPSNDLKPKMMNQKELSQLSAVPLPSRDRSKIDAAPTHSTESPPKRKRKSSESPIRSEKLSAIKERAHVAVLKDQKKNEGIPSTVLQKRARKNAQSRQRAAKLKERISVIQAKQPSARTPEEASILAKFEDRRLKKNGRSRERAIHRKEEFERIFSKPEDFWTEEEKAFMVETMVAKYKKNQGDRMRRKKMKSDGTFSESFEDDSSSMASSSVRSSIKKEVLSSAHLTTSTKGQRSNSPQFRPRPLAASPPSQIGFHCQSPRFETKKGHSDDLLRIPLTPNVALTPILGNITLQHDGSTPDYGKMFDVTPLRDGSLKEYIFDSKRSEGQVIESTALELTSNSILSNPGITHTPRTPNNQRSLPFIQLTSPLDLSPLHLPRRQKMTAGLYESLTGFGNEFHAHENQDKIAVSFSVDSNSDGKFADH
jgi:hypothetical protein